MFDDIKKWVYLAFAPNNLETKNLISLSGGKGGEVYACYWAHDKSKCLASVKISTYVTDIYEIAFNI